jgi:hypothetical protein
MAGQFIWASKEPMDEAGPVSDAGLSGMPRCASRGTVLVVPVLADDSHAGGRILDPPCFSHTLPPAPPTPDLTAWNLPLSDRDVLRVAIVFLAVLVAAEKYVGRGVDVEAGQGTDLGVGQGLMAEPADPHGL